MTTRKSISDPYLDPHVEAMARRVLSAVADLETVGLRVERTNLDELQAEPSLVTDELMRRLAAMPIASMELKAFAARVDRGECTWSEIETSARPVPPEVAELKTSPRYTWVWTTPTAPPAQSEYRIQQSGVVGPSDWPDDYEDYPTQRSWLV
ncbi:hypothetical protein [Nocardia higoensis]|uniref:hypothetical protein n=1 Tax=Nocardia higoensis TaxID=228599 RepID=UPI000688AB7C|nr:hypothetical protein [Nocardia higoensis]